MKWWDIAYFFVQTYTLYKSPQFARAIFLEMLDAFADTNIQNEILVPLLYRSAVSLCVAEDLEAVQLATELFTKIQSKNSLELL